MKKINVPWARSWRVLITIFLLCLIPSISFGYNRYVMRSDGDYSQMRSWEYFSVNNSVVTVENPYIQVDVGLYNAKGVSDAAHGIRIILVTNQGAHDLYYAFHGHDNAVPSNETWISASFPYGVLKRGGINKGDTRTRVVYEFYPSKAAIDEGLKYFDVDVLWDEDDNAKGNVTGEVELESQTGDYLVRYQVDISSSDPNPPLPTFDRSDWNSITMACNIQNDAARYASHYQARWIDYSFGSTTSSKETNLMSMSSTGNKDKTYYKADKTYTTGQNAKSTIYYYVSSRTDDWSIPISSDEGAETHAIVSYIPAVGPVAVTVKGCANATDLKLTEYNKFTNTAKLQWTGVNTNNADYYTDGSWHLYMTRYDSSYKQLSRSEIATLALSNTEYTYNLEKTDYDKYVTFEVVFMRDGWTHDPASVTFDNVKSLGSKTDYISTARGYILGIEQDKSDSTSVSIKWHYEEVMGSDKPKVVIERKVNADGTWTGITSLANLTANNPGDNAIGNNYTDADAKSVCDDYYYRITIHTMDKDWVAETGALWPVNGTYLTKLSVSKGTYSNLARATWKVVQRGVSDTHYVLLRRLLGSTDDTDWKEIHSEQGTKDTYTYEDNTAQPGQYYEYKVQCFSRMCTEKTDTPTSLTDVGFCASSGIISGRITYGTGTAVPNARVSLITTSDSGSDNRQFSSLKINGSGSRLIWKLSDEQTANLFNGKNPFTIQLWVNPNSNILRGDGSTYSTPRVIEICDSIKLNLIHKDNSSYTLTLYQFESPIAECSDIIIPAGTFTNIALTFDGQKWSLRKVSGDSIFVSSKTSSSVCDMSKASNKTLTVGGTIEQDAKSIAPFVGWIDDVRIWKKALTNEEMLNNYDRLLVGTETGLVAYWPLDEQLDKYAFDVSSSNGVSNENHATPELCNTASNVPKELGLYAVSDLDGNYVIRGIRYSDGGTNYNVVPTLGVHSFSPSKDSRYISLNSLNFSGVNFSDISSFPVSGTVYYANTNYPVKGVNFYVDGQVCTRNGNLIESDANGEYLISVPIGDHYVEAKMANHTFVNKGRYPADPMDAGLKVTYTSSRVNLDFADSTLVTIAGRICGGVIENNKKIGFGQSVNNIGQAKITLAPTNTNYYLNFKRVKNGTTFDSYPGKEILNVTTPLSYNSSCVAYRDSGIYARNIVIMTDKATGEFAVSVPPLEYKATTDVINNGKISIEKTTIKATDPSLVKTDSLNLGKSYETFSYVAKFNPEYHSPTFFSVTDEGNSKGAYGELSYTFYDKSIPQKVTINNLYTVNSGVVSYTYGSPIFIQGNRYTFKLKAYENYTNYDKDGPVTSTTVPLANTPVKISNALSSEQFVMYKDSAGYKPGNVVEVANNYVTLDSLGTCEYIWEAGMPDITSPFNGRGFNFTYSINGSEKNWRTNAQVGVIIGSLPTGTNFVTGGPSIVEMILRDPPGSASSATWLKGVTVTNSHEISNKYENEEEGTTVSHLGNTEKIFTGVGAGTISEIGVKHDLTVGADLKIEQGWNNSFTTTVTTQTGFSTSPQPEYVGEQGDVFIGEATNILYGKARKVAFENNNGSYKLALDDAIVSGLRFGTTFAYSVNFIEQTLIPNLILNRNSLLIHSDNVDGYPSVEGKALYVTKLSKNDTNFGANGTYKFVVPKSLPNNTVLEDSVKWYNMQIASWQTAMKNNEIAKVTAKENRTKWLEKNYSFTTGGSISSTVTNDTISKEEEPLEVTASVVIGYGTGVDINETGVDIDLKTTNGYHRTQNNSTETTNTQSISFTLAATGDDDALSVDVFRAPDNKGPIFITRGGQTSCPYEGATYTRYYNPGTELDKATMQIEQPHIHINKVKNATATNVANGTKASFRVALTNTSETGENVEYVLFVAPKSNPDGANVSFDGQSILNGYKVRVNAGDSVVKTLIVSQTKASILKYDSIAIVIGSECQNDPSSTWKTITDTAYVSVQFVASSSPVTLKIPSTTLNTLTGATLSVDISDYDLDYNNFKALRLQYKYANDADWTTIKEYKTAAFMKEGDEQIPAEGIKLNEDLSGYNDGQYMFRVASVAMNGNDEVYLYSDVINVTKDMASPTLIGNAHPNDGILSAGDDISVTFNENIMKDRITKSGNFLVTGALNGAAIDNAVGLKLAGNNPTAYTEANITLSEKSFTIESWLLPQKSGTFFSHGKSSNKLKLGLNSWHHLIVNIGDNSYISADSVPMGKWQYLSVSYNAENKTIDAYSLYDGTTLHLLNARKATDYTGQGNITLGGDFCGVMHELTLWDGTRSLAETTSQMNVTKNPLTQGLIGYWKLDEGSGKSAVDAARHRNMVLPSESWYLNNVNKSVSLDGTKAVLLPMASIVPSNTDNFAIELWFKGDKSNQTSATPVLFSTDKSGCMSVKFNSDGQLSLVQGTNSLMLNQVNYLDNVWHHFAMNVLRQGNANFYVDGALIKQASASTVNTPQGATLIIGAENGYANFFKGNVDEVRFWNATLNGVVLNNSMRTRLSGTEAGLKAYYPFEEKTLDSGNQVITVTSENDKVNTGSKASSSAGTMTYSDDTPAIKEMKTETNLDFNFVSDERNIVLTLINPVADLEGCTLNFVVKDVYDYNGNVCSPIRWSAYIRQNQLLWSEDAATVVQQAGTGSSFTASFSNGSGEIANWNISGLPAWLTVSSSEGILEPLKTKNITFNVSSATPVGKYEQTVYLVGDNNIYEPFTVNVKVKAEKPAWSVNPAAYGSSMSVIGALKFNGAYSVDEDDIVAAFNGDVCVGVASPQYNSKYDSYFVFLDIYGNDGDIGHNITFKAWDASSGTIYPVVTTSQNVAFQSDMIIGSVSNLFIWNGENKIEQKMNYVKGWNWISFYVNKESKKPDDIFSNVIDKITNVKSRTQFAAPKDGQFNGSLQEMPVESSYMVQANNDFSLSLTGDAVDIPNTPITLSKGWSWIGYVAPFISSVDYALGGAEPHNGDVIKSRMGFAQFDGTQWLGSLKYLSPGEGYKYMNGGGAEKKFTYPSVASASAKAMADALPVSTWKRHFTENDVSAYADNATYTLTLTVNGIPVSKDVDIATYNSNGICCGVSDIDPKNPNVFYLVAFGNTNDKLTYHLWINGKEFTTSSSLNFVTNAVESDTIDVTPYVEGMSEDEDYVPAPLTGVTYGYFALTRSFEAGSWNTIMLPFDMDAEQIKNTFGDGTSVKAYTSCTQNGVATELEFSDAQTITANTPCLIKVGVLNTDNKYYLAGLAPKVGTIFTVTNGGLELVGNYSGATGKVAAGNYFLANDKIYSVTSDVNFKGFRAYLHDTNVPSLKNFQINIKNNATGINEILEGASTLSNGNIYDLGGSLIRKGNTSTQGLKPGVYIIDGKKIVIK
jgi:hypothetical protein